MTEKIPPEFFDLADKFIDLANDLTRQHGTARVSSVFMFAASRFNAHTVAATDADARSNRSVALDYMVDQYRKMLTDNLDEMLGSLSLAPKEP